MNFKFLLSASAFAMMGLCAMAEDAAVNQYYTTYDIGELNGVADSGRYAVINDSENLIAYLWDSTEPNVFTDISQLLSPTDTPSAQQVSGTEVYDVSNWGQAVGCIWYKDGHSVPAYYKNGAWVELPSPEKALNTRVATCITPDGKVIAGYYGVKSEVTGDGMYYPVRWTLQENGEYTMEDFATLKLPEHQGFITLSMTRDGRILGGYVCCGMQSTVPALLVDGRLEMFHEISYRESPWEFGGKWFAGWTVNDKGESVQKWVDDPNDPEVVLFRQELIDGYYDGNASLEGLFCFCDKNDNFYGNRTQLEDISEDGETATLIPGACIYNEETDEWIYNLDYEMFTCGTSPNLMFTNYNKAVVEGVDIDLPDYLNVKVDGVSFGASKVSMDGTVIGCVRGIWNEAIGNYDFFPYIVVTSEFTGVQQVYGGAEACVIVNHGVISVRNAEDAELYDINGMLLGRGVSFEPGAGTYVVRMGGKSVKVML